MSFITSALGTQNGLAVNSGAAPNQQAANAQQTQDLTNFNNTQNNQSALAQQLLAQANGQGPNIANLQLQQATNQNNQQEAGAIASQRGMNPALAQRIIAQQTAANNQNAAGQSGVLRAQQQLAAQNNLANVYGQQAGESQANYGTITGAQTAANSSNAQIAQNNANQAGSVAGGLLGAGATGLLMASEGGEIPAIHKHLQDLLIAIGPKVHPLHLAQGGGFSSFGNEAVAIDPSLAANGSMGFTPATPKPKPNPNDPNDPASRTAALNSFNQLLAPTNGAGASGLDSSGALPSAALMNAAHGGKVPAMLSPGELRIPRDQVAAVTSGKEKASKVGQRVPGKAKVKGDSEKNDIIPAALSEGDVIVKRTKADNDKDAREFLLAIQKEKASKHGPSGYAKVLQAKRRAS